MTAVIRGNIQVKPHVQQACDLLEDRLKVKLDFSTYYGHSPPEGPTQAVDIFNRDNAAGYAQQDRICEFFIAHAEELGVRYLIRREYIWNIERADEGWRWQGHQGNRTADHWDHVHVTFYASARGLKLPVPPISLKGTEDMMTIFYQRKGEDWFMDRASKTYGRLPFGSLIDTMTAKGDARKYGPQDDEFHKGIVAWAEAAGFSGIFTEEG